MLQLRKTAEARLEDLKGDLGVVEAELEEARSQASVGGQMGKQSEEVREKERELVSKSLSTKQIKEKALNTEDIEQRVVSGLGHLGEMLGIPPRVEEAPISDLLRDIDAILETLIDEMEKQQSQTMASTADQSASRVLATREPNPAVSFIFPSSLELAFAFAFASSAFSLFPPSPHPHPHTLTHSHTHTLTHSLTRRAPR